MENFRYFDESNLMQIRMIGIVKISYILHAWILTSIAFPSAQKVSSVKSLYA